MNKRLLALLLCALLILPAFAACGANPPADISDGTSNKATTTSSTTVSSASTTVSTDAASSFATTTKAPTKSTAKTTTAKTTTTAIKPTEEPKTDTLDLAVDGKSTYVIIRGKNSTRPERNAASELQDYIQKITGCSIPVKTDDIAPTACEIVVGKTNREKSGDFNRDELGTDGFIIKTADKKLYLVGGGDRGTLYAVYEFLESYLGCRFYTAGVEKVPQTDTIALNPIKEDKQIPCFEYRCVHWSEYYNSQNISVKRKLNGGTINENWGGSINYADREMMVHTVDTLVPPTKYFGEHPEYYRLTPSGERDPGQLCFSNPDVLKIAIDVVREYLTDNPHAELISVSQEDYTPGNCNCADCSKTDALAGSYAGTLLNFVNAVARDIKSDFPNVKIHTLAYQYTRGAPISVKPEDNVLVQLCDIECCFSHPLNTACNSAAVSFYEDLVNWTALCDTLYVWDYVTNFAHYNMTYPNFSCLRENIRFFAENGVDGIFEDGNSHSISGEFGELRSYLLAKCLWDPYMTEAEYYAHMDDFLKGVYGDGWQHIREYIDFAETIGDAVHFGIVPDVEDLYPTIVNMRGERELPTDLTLDHILNYQNTDWEPYINWYTDVKAHPIVPKGQECFAKAIALAKTANQKERLERASIQTDYIQSYYYYHLYRKYLREDMVKLITHYLTTNTPLTDAEITSLSNQVADYVDKQYADAYFAYNSKLWERIFSYKIAANCAHYHQQLNPNLRKIPSRWYEY
ncbi:MAG: DUF4838 domain-containing protein [Clostridia bacterium]|nr:DUF4838 domain-containing protein [Clostridia bacterium]